MVEQTLGFIGLGQMGGPMAKHLVEAGHALSVYDTDPAAMRVLTDMGASAAGSASGPILRRLM